MQHANGLIQCSISLIRCNVIYIIVDVMYIWSNKCNMLSVSWGKFKTALIAVYSQALCQGRIN